MNLLSRLHLSSGFYPLTQFYVAAVLVLIATVNGWLNLTQAIVILGFTCVIALGVMMWREARTIHRLVDGQRSEMIDRLDQLTDLLVENGIHPPAEGPKTYEARVEVADEKRSGTFPGGS